MKIKLIKTFGIISAVAVALCELSAAETPSCVAPPAGLVGWWAGEGNANDSVDSNHGTLFGGLGFAPGEVGHAFNINANGKYVKVPASPNLNVGASDGMTIECWINPTDVVNERPVVEWNSATGSSGADMLGVHLWLSTPAAGGGPGCVFANVFDTAHTSHYFSSIPGLVQAGQWQHIALTYEKSSGIALLYLNGAEVARTNFSSFTPQTSYNLYLGWRPGPLPIRSFSGLLDEVGVYNRALPAGELLSIYNAGTAGKCLTNAPATLTLQPHSQTVSAGADVTFSAAARGTLPLSYQWQFNGVDILGAAGPSLTLNNVQTNQAGNYLVYVTNEFGMSVSSNALLTVILPASVTPPEGLVSWWAGEGNATDILGANNGVAQGELSYGPGEVGQAFLLNGANSAVKVPASASLNVGTGPGFTVETWINPARVTGISPVAEWYDISQPMFGAHLHVRADWGPGSLYADIVAAGGYSHGVHSTAGVIVPNTWQHVALTYDRSSGRVFLYRNGDVVGSGYVGSFVPQTSYDFHIGVRPGWDGPFYFDGNIDEMSLYNRALTSNEVASIYWAGTLGKSQPSGLPVITQQPQSQSVIAGAEAVFSVAATGTRPLGYQWRKDGIDIPGATNAAFAIHNVQTADAGAYSVLVNNQSGSITSSDAQLTIRVLACVTPPAGLVSWWAGEENANDSADSNHGALHGGLGFAPGKVGQAFNINAYGKYAQVPASPSLDVGASDGMTVECWINPHDIVNERPVVEWNSATGYSGADMLGVHLWLSTPAAGGGPGCVFANIFDTARTSHYFSSVSGLVKSGIWQHISLTYEKSSGIALLYLNGAEVARTNFGAFTPQTSYDLYLGWRPGPLPIRSFDGLLDEVGIYNRALAANEIAAIYDADAAGKCVTPAPPTIFAQPASQTVLAGADVTFNVFANGTPPLSYQWQFNGVDLVGATNHSLTLSNVQTNQAGNYSVIVANTLETVTSSTALLTVNLPTPIDPFSGLVSWWAGEGNTADRVGGNNGQAQGNLSYAPGQVGQAFVFSGTNHVKVPASPSLNVGTGPGFTVETWINPARVTGILPVAEWYNITQPMFGTHLHVRDDFGAGGLYADVVGNGGSHGVFSAPGVIVPNTWQHVAVAFDKLSGQVSLYHNGVSVARRTVGSFVPQTSYDFYIGTRPGWDGPFYFDGLMDEVGLYSRALTSNEIAAIYTAGSAGKNQSLPPTITSQPLNQTVPAGGAATFSVGVSGTPPLTYQWLFNGADIAGETSATLTLNAVGVDQAGNYSVRVTNAFGAAVSANAALSIQSEQLVPPVITLQPHSQIVSVGAAVSFTVSATGSAPLSYQWRFNNAELSGATNDTLALSAVQPSQAGGYSVKVSNPAGFTNSALATLTVWVASGGTLMFNNRDLFASIDAPISFSGDGPAPQGEINGGAAVTNGDFTWGGVHASAGLYAGPAGSAEEQLVLLEPEVGFRTGAAAGYVAVSYSSSRFVPGVAAGAPAVAQIRVWDAGLPGVSNYEAAVTLAQTRGIYLGKSALINIEALGGAGMPPSFPATLTGLTAFNAVYTDLGVRPMAAPPLTVEEWRSYSQTVRAQPVKLAIKNATANAEAMRLEFQGVMGQTYFIQASANLVDWVTIGTSTTSIDGAVQFDDPESGAAPARFYRVVVP